MTTIQTIHVHTYIQISNPARKITPVHPQTPTTTPSTTATRRVYVHHSVDNDEGAGRLRDQCFGGGLVVVLLLGLCGGW